MTYSPKKRKPTPRKCSTKPIPESNTSLIQEAEISVVIPHYNHGALLPEAVHSCLDQSLSPLEIIIVDDGSASQELAVAEKLAQQYLQIRLIKNERNTGVVYSINKGLEAVKGEFIVFRAADDLSLPDSFKTAHEVLSLNPQAGVCFGDVLYFADDPKCGQVERIALDSSPAFFTPEEFSQTLTSSHFLSGASTMVRTSAIRKENGQPPSLQWYADWYTFLSIAFQHGACCIPIPTVGFRLDANSYGNSGTQDIEAKNRTIIELLKKLAKQPPNRFERFIESGSLELFGKKLLQELIPDLECLPKDIKNKILSKLDTPKLSSIDAAKRDIGLPGVIRRCLLESKIKVQQTTNKKGHIFIYGAGTHTEVLLDLWNEENYPAPHAIITSTPQIENKFRNIPLKSINDIHPKASDLIVLSSKSYESSLKETCFQLWPHCQTISIWLKETSPQAT